MSIGAIGAAISGLAKGYQEGARFQAEMDEKEQSKRLREMQIEGYGLTLGKQKREDAFERDMAETLKKVFDSEAPQPAATKPTATNPVAATAPAAGIAAPQGEAAPSAQPAGISSPTAPAAGVAAPGAMPAAGATPAAGAAPAAGGRKLSIGMLGKIIDAQQDVMLRHNKLDVGQAMNMMRNYSTLQKEGVLEGLMAFATNPTEEGRQQALQIINSTGRTPLDPNSKFEKKSIDLGGGMMMDDVVVTTPGGATFTLANAAYNAMSPEKAMSLKHDLGWKIQDLTLKKTAEENLNKARIAELDIKKLTQQELVRHHQALEKESNARTTLLAEQRKDADAARAIKLREEASSNALKQILQGNGVSRETTAKDLEMLDPNAQAAYRQRVEDSFAAHTIWAMNMDAKNNPSISTAEASLIQRAWASGQIKSSQIKVDDEGMSSINWRGKQVVLPIPPTQRPQAAAPSQPQPGQQPQPAAAPAPRQGIANPYVDSRGNRIPNPPEGAPSLMTSTVAPAVGQAVNQATTAVSNFAANQPIEYLRGKISRNEPLSPVEMVRARQAGLIQ